MCQRHVAYNVGNCLTLSLVPFSAKYLAIIFMLRPLIAANMIGKIVGP
jgi:hypothetical protein